VHDQGLDSRYNRKFFQTSEVIVCTTVIGVDHVVYDIFIVICTTVIGVDYVVYDIFIVTVKLSDICIFFFTS